MARIIPVEMNMDFSKKVYSEWSDNDFIATAQKIAVYSVIPIGMIIFFEAVVKNLIFINFINMTITIINETQDFLTVEKKSPKSPPMPQALLSPRSSISSPANPINPLPSKNNRIRNVVTSSLIMAGIYWLSSCFRKVQSDSIS